jgi:hypothetical protein
MTHTDLARQMLAAGRPATAIINALVARGVKRNTAYTVVYRARHRPGKLKGANLPGGILAAICDDTRAALHREARSRRMTTALLAGLLLSSVVRDGLVDAVLDEAAE